MGSLKRVYIAHPLSALTPEGIEENRKNAALWVAWAFSLGYAPVCSWITITAHIEDNPQNRARGLECDKREVETCDEVFMCGPHVSSGMRIEGLHALERNVPVRDFTYLAPDLGGKPPPLDWTLFWRLWKP